MTTELSTTTDPATRDEPRFVQDVRRIVQARDREALRGHVTAAGPEELAEAAAWFAKRGRVRLAEDEDWVLNAGIPFEEMLDRCLVRSVVTVALNTPAAAVKMLPWRTMAAYPNVHILLLLDVLASRGEDWCRSFVAAAMGANAKAGQAAAVVVIRHCLPLILHFGVSTDGFAAYPRLWTFYYREVLAGPSHHEVWNEEIAAKLAYPGWSGVEFRLAPDGRAELFPNRQKSLLALWDQDATAPATLLRCFGVANALGPLAKRGTPDEWTVGAAVRGYLERGTYARAEVLDGVFTALARTDGTPTQRVLADVLQALQPARDEVAVRIPQLLSTVATAQGVLSSQALGLLLTVPLGAGDLQELSTAVFGRTEKKPQGLLVRHLKSAQAAGRYDDGVLAACWEAAAGSTDLLIRTKAGEMLRASAAASASGVQNPPADQMLPPDASLWGTGAGEPWRSPRYVPLEVDPTRWFPEWHKYWAEPIAEEQYVDRFLRAVYHQPEDVRGRYRERYPVRDRAEVTYHAEGLAATRWGWWGDPDPETVVSMWASGEHGLVGHRRLAEMLQASAQPGPYDRNDPFHAATPLARVRILRLSELTVQAGTVAYSLATPSYRNFKLDLGRLVAVLRVYEDQGWSYGEADFFQSLLRLGPLPAEGVAGIPELPVRPLDGSADPERSAGHLLRVWAEGGGFTAPAVDTPLVLPVPLELFPTLPPGLVEPSIWNGGNHGYAHNWLTSAAAAVVPFWPDLGAVWLRRRVVHVDLVANRADGVDTGTAGELGELTYEWLLDSLASPDPHLAGRTLKAVLGLAAGHQVSAQGMAAAARTRVQAGVPLGRLVRKLALIAYEGHLDCVWPAITALVVVCADQQKLPAGTPELLATCTELWDAIPAEHRGPQTVPDDFSAAVLAWAAKKSTKTGLEAQRLASRMGLEPSSP